MVGLMMMACIDNGKKSEAVKTDSQEVMKDSLDALTDSLIQKGGYKIEPVASAGDDAVKSIYKVWMSEDGTCIFDLRDEKHYVEARMYDEEYCKEFPDYKPGVYYIDTEAGGFEVDHDFPEQGDSVGSIKYLLEQGPYAGTYALRFSFYDMTTRRVTFLFEGEYEWTYKVLDKPVVILPNPHPYVYEE
jgi:hypothetical protein